MKTILAITAVAFLSLSCNSKAPDPQSEINNSHVDTPTDRAQVLLVGTFHMDYPGLDLVQTEEQDKIDVLTDQRQQEMREVLAYVNRFSPNKIAIEATDSWNASGKLQQYKDGAHRDKRDERYQVAMALAVQEQIDTLYSIDARSLSSELYEKGQVRFVDSITSNVDWDYMDEDLQYALSQFEAGDNKADSLHLLEYLKSLNTDEAYALNLGSYFTSSFVAEDSQYADYLSMWWYNRNLRMMRKILRSVDSRDDRIVVLVGAGHAAILEHMIEAAPQVDLVRFNDL